MLSSLSKVMTVFRHERRRYPLRRIPEERREHITRSSLRVKERLACSAFCPAVRAVVVPACHSAPQIPHLLAVRRLRLA